MNNYGRTLINELPDLDDLELKTPTVGQYNPNIQQSQKIQPEISNKFNKFIRPTGHKTPQQSGMNVEKIYTNKNNTINDRELYEIDEYSDQDLTKNKDYNNSISCIEINNHICGCPICSKFYNNDKTPYIIIIGILIIICILLLKKLIEILK